MAERHGKLCSRRHFLHGGAMALGPLGLASLLHQEGLLAAPPKPQLEPVTYDLKPKKPPRPPKAKAMISLFMIGGPSQMDLFDPKPKLKEYDGKKFPGEVQYDNIAQASSKVLGPGWKFKKYGKSGLEMSELVPQIGSVADDICLIRSMHTGVNNHLPSMWALNTGKAIGGRPSLGSWLTYGLGSESQNLPAFVALIDPTGAPLIGGENWTNGWLPSIYQGTVVRPKDPRILHLDPPPRTRGKPQEEQLALLRELNAQHLAEHPGELDLQARIASYELAARMQTAAKEAFDLSGESKATLKNYGVDEKATDNYGRRCLIARRLVERGVRFVQIFANGQIWDHHGSIKSQLPARCLEVDRPVAALIADLKARGLLDSTLVHWGGEMGRLPVIQNDAGPDQVGRDHNTYGFSMFLAGGGVKGGMAYGETDDFSHRAVKDVVHHYDYQATLLNLFGFDHSKLVYKHQNRDLTLVDDSAARVVKEILA